MLTVASLSNAKEWHGIVPLHSTRADVERLLGPSTDPTKEHASIHKTKNEVVLVVYASGPPCGTDARSMWQVPRGTVVSLTVASRREQQVTDLPIDITSYEKIEDGHLPGITRYISEEEGISIEVDKDKVTDISYFASAKDKYLRCLK